MGEKKRKRCQVVWVKSERQNNNEGKKRRKGEKTPGATL